ncbi:hypothetical protein ACWCPF_34780 [Streptomyces sp. NPDC001858]
MVSVARDLRVTAATVRNPDTAAQLQAIPAGHPPLIPDAPHCGVPWALAEAAVVV